MVNEYRRYEKIFNSLHAEMAAMHSEICGEMDRRGAAPPKQGALAQGGASIVTLQALEHAQKIYSLAAALLVELGDGGKDGA